MSVVLDSKWVELETSSSFELNALLHDSTNIFLGMKDSHTRSAYNTFTINNQTMSSLFFLNVFISLFSATLLQILITDFSPHYNYNGYVHWIICTIYLVIINIAGWSAYVYHRWSFSGNNGSIPFQSRRTLQRIQMALYFAINFFVCYRHITRSVNGQCPIDQNVNNNWNCNPVGLSKGISGETSIIIMIIPIMYSISVRGAHFEFAMFLWFMTVGTLLFSIIYPGATNGILFVTYYCIGSLAALVEARRNNLFLFFTHQKLQEFLQAKEKAADAANAEEMRHMIGNVAHDLKTVSAYNL